MARYVFEKTCCRALMMSLREVLRHTRGNALVHRQRERKTVTERQRQRGSGRNRGREAGRAPMIARGGSAHGCTHCRDMVYVCAVCRLVIVRAAAPTVWAKDVQGCCHVCRQARLLRRWPPRIHKLLRHAAQGEPLLNNTTSRLETTYALYLCARP